MKTTTAKIDTNGEPNYEYIDPNPDNECIVFSRA